MTWRTDAELAATSDELWDVERQLADMDRGGPGTDEHRRLLEARQTALEAKMRRLSTPEPKAEEEPAGTYTAEPIADHVVYVYAPGPYRAGEHSGLIAVLDDSREEAPRSDEELLRQAWIMAGALTAALAKAADGREG